MARAVEHPSLVCGRFAAPGTISIDNAMEVQKVLASELLWLDKSLGKELSIKTEIIGPDEGKVKEPRVLNRVIR